MRASKPGARPRRLAPSLATFVVAMALAGVWCAGAAFAQGSGEPGKAEQDAQEQAELQRLVKKLNGRSAAERRGAASGLGALGKKAASAVPHLVSRLSDGDHGVRGAAAEALGRIGDASAKVVGALANALGQKTPARASIAIGLGDLGEPAQSAIPALQKALADATDARTRAMIIRAFGRIGASEPKQKKAIVDLTRGELQRATDRELKTAAAIALVRLGEADAAVVSPLADVAQGKNGQDLASRTEAVEALLRLGPVSAPAVPQLADVVKEPFVPNPALPYQEEERRLHGALRVVAAKTLGGLGAGAKAALSALRTASESEDGDVREAAKAAISKIQAA